MFEQYRLLGKASKIVLGCGAAFLTSPLTSAMAEAVTYTVDPTQSVISITNVEVDVLFPPFNESNPFTGVTVSAENDPAITTNSFEARYGGTLQVDLTDTSFEILAGSVIQALDEDSYLPGINSDTSNTVSSTPAPASYAVSFPGLYANGVSDFAYAVRGLEFSLADAASKSITGDTFDAAGTTVVLSAGDSHLNTGNPPLSHLTEFNIANRTVTNVSLASAMITDDGFIETVSMPFEFTVILPQIITTTTTYQGTIVATRAIPEPASLALLTMGGVLLATRRRNAH